MAAQANGCPTTVLYQAGPRVALSMQGMLMSAAVARSTTSWTGLMDIVWAVFAYRRSRKEGNSAGKTAAVLVITIVVLVSLGFGAHALVDALTK